jgi:hypothetical protein
MSYHATLVVTDTTTLDATTSDLTPAQAWEQRRHRLRESGTTHQADRHTLTLAWTDPNPPEGIRREITLTFGGTP